MTKTIKLYYNINDELIIFIFRASLVQMVEHRSPKPSVEGSSPSGRVLRIKKTKPRNFIKLPNFKIIKFKKNKI